MTWAPRRRPAPLRGEWCPDRLRPRGARAEAARAEFPRCALRAFFHAFRVAAACRRARLASRLASFIRLRARLSSSLAIRTRCLATSACSRARSRGSAGSSAAAAPELDLGEAASAPPRASDGGVPADRLSRAVFPMGQTGVERGEQFHTMVAALPPLGGRGRTSAFDGAVVPGRGTLSQRSANGSARARAASWRSRGCGRNSCCDRGRRRRPSVSAPRACARRPERDRDRRGQSSP